MISLMLHLPTLNFANKGTALWRTDAWISLFFLLLLLGWDATPRDLTLAHWWGNSSGFPLRDNWWMRKVMHEGTRSVGWGIFIALLVGIWRPWGALRSLSTSDRAGVFISVLCALLSVTLIKGFSQTSCPWDLQAFGGLAAYVPHWDLWQQDGAGGHCFPAGHASTGFAFMGAYFGIRQSGDRRALKWLAIALIAGIVLGVSQQMRGAHFMSHTFWTAWLCWTTGWLSHHAFNRVQAQTSVRP